ncbi:RDD family protein [Halorubellus sp. JP-L1]|uniref:RDD family protein n=1 Tax=Halorubellus sp. JP-L1 TaxID=2715753 RepID=UPI001409AE99|nr:RDD family protein [Halorubellus sp. JP-L1]NHN43479.1 RDD family protein [Halorubellus sp. JP-L1]
MATSQEARLNVDVFGERIVAQIVDGIIQVVLAFGLLIGLTGVAGAAAEASESVASGIGLFGLLVAFAAMFFYNAGLEYYWDGQTVGKRLMGIKVVDESGDAASFGQTIVRNIPAVFNLGIFSVFAALLTMALSDKTQRIFDVLASTIVVEKASGAEPEHSTDTSWGSDADQSTQF